MAQQWRYPASPIPAAAGTPVTAAALTSEVNEIDLGITLSSTTGSPSVTLTDFSAEYSG